MSLFVLQIDNQLFSAQRPVLLSIAPSKADMPDNTPALHMAFHKNPSQWNVEIFKVSFMIHYSNGGGGQLKA